MLWIYYEIVEDRSFLKKRLDAMTGKKILIADDDPSVCKVVSRVLASKGMEPEVANNGEDALAHLAREQFDAVVLDIKMDDMDGFEVLEKIRGTDLDIPVIILSGNNENYNMLLGLESGADDYMTKPFDPAFLAAKIQALLRQRRRGPGQCSGPGTCRTILPPCSCFAAARRFRFRRRSTPCSASSWKTKAALSPRRSFTTGYGATANATKTRSWSMSAACAEK